MLLVHFGLAVIVAGEASELGEVIGVGMASFAVAPPSSMRTGKDREVEAVVICEVRVLPGVVGVAEQARCWKIGAAVFGVIGALMTGNAVVLTRG